MTAICFYFFIRENDITCLLSILRFLYSLPIWYSQLSQDLQEKLSIQLYLDQRYLCKSMISLFISLIEHGTCNKFIRIWFAELLLFPDTTVRKFSWCGEFRNPLHRYNLMASEFKTCFILVCQEELDCHLPYLQLKVDTVKLINCYSQFMMQQCNRWFGVLGGKNLDPGNKTFISFFSLFFPFQLRTWYWYHLKMHLLRYDSV